MSTKNISALLLLLVVFVVPALAQDAKPGINDQLWEAVRKGDAVEVTALLDKGADVNAKFRYGMTALFKAAERGHIEVVKVLLARGADVTVKDSFYGATAMTWALNNDHFDVVRALLEKSEGVDEVLANGARSKKVPLVQIALEKGGAKPATLTSALVMATTGEDKNDEIAALLKKAGAVPPAAIEATLLQSYVGKYKSEQGRDYEVTAKDGLLFITFTGGLFALVPTEAHTFTPAAFDGVTLVFKVEADKVNAIELKQGPQVTVLKRQ